MRISRATFWKILVPLPIAGYFVLQLDVALQTGAWRIAPSGPALLFYWTLIAACVMAAVFVMRAHDRNKSGWWALLYMVPYVGWAWALVELGFLAGTDGPNRFGPDPRAPIAASGLPTVAAPPAAQDAAFAPASAQRPTAPLALAEANQFLRYRAGSRAKVDAQITLMGALLARPDAPIMTVALLRSADPADEFPWLIVKSATRQAMAAMRAYAGFEETFAAVFADQPFSIVWADHIAENCPGPGEAVTPRGREIYACIADAIAKGQYVLERQVPSRSSIAISGVKS